MCWNIHVHNFKITPFYKMKTDSVESRRNKEQYLITKLKPKMNQISLYTNKVTSKNMWENP